MNLIRFITSDFNFALMLFGVLLIGFGVWCMSDRHQYFLFHLLGGAALIAFGVPIILLAL